MFSECVFIGSLYVLFMDEYCFHSSISHFNAREWLGHGTGGVSISVMSH